METPLNPINPQVSEKNNPQVSEKSNPRNGKPKGKGSRRSKRYTERRDGAPVPSKDTRDGIPIPTDLRKSLEEIISSDEGFLEEKSESFPVEKTRMEIPVIDITKESPSYLKLASFCEENDLLLTTQIKELKGDYTLVTLSISIVGKPSGKRPKRTKVCSESGFFPKGTPIAFCKSCLAWKLKDTFF